MRLAFGISLILLGLMWLAATFDVRQPTQTEAAHWKDAPAGTKWRRTTGGWQRVEHVVAQQERAQPTTLHPMVVATLQLLLSVLALVLLPAKSRRPQRSTSTSSVSESPSPTHRRQKTQCGVTR